MTHLTGVQTDLAPPAVSPAPAGPDFVRWICTSNPFYVLSALLVCLGLWVSFGGQADAAQTWSLLGGMASYTLLLAVTASLLVRLVGVWDDVRTVLLLVVLMFLATSVTFDEVLARAPARGVACYLAGLGFAVIVSEGMLRGVRLTLPALFRLPYDLALALFFLYPVLITPLLDRPQSEALVWALFGFGPAAGLVALTLLPAVRRGRGYVAGNGSPWRWAWYPWTVFGVLAFAVPARAALLCWSMHHVAQAATEPYIFGPYFLIPFLLAVAVVLLEIGLVERLKPIAVVAQALPVLGLALAAVGHRPEAFYQNFLGLFIARTGGTPLYLASLAAVGFAGYATLRRAPQAIEILAALLAALAFIAPDSLSFADLGRPRALPILAVGGLQLALGWRRREALRSLIGAACLVVAAATALPERSPDLPRGPLAFGLIELTLLVVGAAFDTPFGRFLRNLGVGAVVLGCLAMITGQAGQGAAIPAWAREAYPPAMAVVLVGYGVGIGHRPAVRAAGLIGAGWLVATGWTTYLAARQAVVGLDYLVVGMGLFALAVLTSVVKGGALPRKSRPGPRSLGDPIDLIVDGVIPGEPSPP